MQTKRILHVIPDLSKGGAERLTLDICIALTQRGVDVRLVNFRGENAYPYLSASINREVIPARFIPSVTGKAVVELDALRAYIENFKPDIIHSHLFEAEIVTRQIIMPGVKYFTHLHDNMPQFRNFTATSIFKARYLTDLYEKRLIIQRYRQCGNRFIAISNDTAQYFRNALPADLHNITVLHNAIDFARFRGTPESLPTKEKVRLVTTGSLVDKKNQIFLVDVMMELKRHGFNAVLDVLGDGPNRQKIERRIEGASLKDTMILHGNVERVEDFLHRAHIYVHPATYEPFGLALLEAMAAGLPCVMLDGRGNRDIAEDGRNGFLLKEQNAAVFAQKILQLISDGDLYRMMSSYAVSFAARFDIKKYTARLLDLYNSSD